jgi:hypothetical protein
MKIVHNAWCHVHSSCHIAGRAQICEIISVVWGKTIQLKQRPCSRQTHKSRAARTAQSTCHCYLPRQAKSRKDAHKRFNKGSTNKVTRVVQHTLQRVW